MSHPGYHGTFLQYLPNLSVQPSMQDHHFGFITLFAAVTLVAAHGSGAWLDLRHHSASSSYSGVRVRAALFPLRVSSPSVNMTINACGCLRVRCRSMFRRPRTVSH